MSIKVESLFSSASDPETNREQQRIIREIYAQHGVDYDEVKKGLEQEGPGSLAKYGSALSEIETHKWILENAAIRGRTQGFTVFGLLRMMVNFRSRIAKK